jgi:OmcA/MtrC family decaheme c-type cytochrome
MNGYQIGMHGKKIVFGLSFIAGISLLAACSGDDGSTGPAGPQGVPGTSVSSEATELSMEITGVTVASPPVVNFTVSNEAGQGYTGFTDTDLRFDIAKLTPGTDGNPSTWQNYILTGGDENHGSQERNRGRDTDIWGELVNHGDGSYTYTFETDITNVTCPDPCKTAEGTPLDVSYQPGLTHRVGIQQGNSALPKVNAIFDFVPSGGDVTSTREIVKTANCNQCHNQVTGHGTRVETKLCVTCHNPGSWVLNDDDSTTPVDFKVMIHKIHRGENLPSGGYAVGTHDFSDVVFPQDIRNCTKCHDGSDADAENYTVQGDNWKTQPSWQACGSCHDDIDFTKNGVVDAPNYDPSGHPGGKLADTVAEIDNSKCLECHSENKIAGSIEEKHAIPEQLARTKFKLNIDKVTCLKPDTTPDTKCTPGDTPTVTFYVSDPTNGDAKYDIASTKEIFNCGSTLKNSSLSMLVAWDNKDYNNTDSGIDLTGGHKAPSAANSIPISLTGAVETPAGSHIYTVSAANAAEPFVIPDGSGPNGYTATGSGTVAFIGRLVADFNGNGICEETLENGDRERIFPKSVVASFIIDDAKVVARRQVVDNAKCNKCHEQVSLHGGSRNGEALVCVICHNPNQTDVKDRPRFDVTAGDEAGDIDVDSTVDGKREESVDFRRMIHGIHAGAASAHGFREEGLNIGADHDFSDVRFPGILQDCETCHLPGTYVLDGDWELPTENGILSSTIAAAPLGTTAAEIGAEVEDPADDLNITPTAAVCSSCHDGDLAKAHMEVPGGAVFAETQGVISGAPVIETCAICHGPGRSADVELVHAGR